MKIEIRRGNQDEDARSAFINIHELVELGNIPSFPLHPTSINANARFNATLLHLQVRKNTYAARLYLELLCRCLSHPHSNDENTILHTGSVGLES